MVSCLEGQLHGLETGNQVEVREVVGMETLNGKTFTVKGMLSCDTKSTKIIILCGLNWNRYQVFHNSLVPRPSLRTCNYCKELVYMYM